MEEKKENVEEIQLKMNSTSIMLVVFALFLIGGGIALIATGNNKSLISKDQVNREKYSDVVTNEPKVEDPDIVIRNHTPQELTVAKAIELIENEKKLHGDTWTISVANIKGVNKDYSYLVEVDVVLEDGTVDALETIISTLDEKMKVEYPLWHEGEVDLSFYAFNPIETKVDDTTLVETPTDAELNVEVETPVDQVENTNEEEVVETPEVVENEEEVTE
jgi:hypothetical protein